MFEHTLTTEDTIRLRVRDAWKYRLNIDKQFRRSFYALIRRDIKRLRALNKSLHTARD